MIAAKRLEAAPNSHLVQPEKLHRSPRGAGLEPAPQQGKNTAVSCYIEGGYTAHNHYITNLRSFQALYPPTGGRGGFVRPDQDHEDHKNGGHNTKPG